MENTTTIDLILASLFIGLVIYLSIVKAYILHLNNQLKIYSDVISHQAQLMSIQDAENKRLQKIIDDSTIH